MRVFIPATFDMLESLRDNGDITPLRDWAFAVTPALREFFTEGDEDELADVAFTDAARASLRLLTDGGGRFPHRRVVVAADVDDSVVTAEPDMGDGVVAITGSVAMADVAALHVDLEQAEDFVEKAIPLVDAADMGDEDAELTVGDALEIELAWYAPGELSMLVELL